MVRYGSGHGAETRAKIVESAGQILRERGFTETSVGTVMQSVGLTNGGFYAHFPDKTAMLTAAVTAAYQDSPKNFSFLAKLAAEHGDAGLIAKHYLAAQRVADVAGGCPAAALISEIHRQEPPVQAAFQQGAEETAQAIATTPGFSDPEEPLGWAALAMLVGGLSFMRAMPDTKINDDIRNQIGAALRLLAQSKAAS
jgi:TetR/AcrR family transcriptional regulator, transcriptional repressor for nem operon